MPVGTGIIGARPGCRAPPQGWSDQRDPQSAPCPAPLHLDHTAAALLGWAWCLSGSRQHQWDKSWCGRASDGVLLLPQVTPPAKQQARADPVPARHRRDRTCRPSRLLDNGALLPRRPGPARTGHHRMRESLRSRHTHDTSLSNRPVSISPAPKPYKAAQTGCLLCLSPHAHGTSASVRCPVDGAAAARPVRSRCASPAGCPTWQCLGRA